MPPSLPPDAGPAHSHPVPPPNRRACRRRPARASTQVACQKGAWGLGANVAVAVLDVSEDGAQLVVREALAVGQEVEVSLAPPWNGRPVKVAGRVVWSGGGPGGNYRAGVCFGKRLPYADLLSVTAP